MERKIPIVIGTPVDPFYSSANLNRIMKADDQIKRGKVIDRSLEELEAMADE